MDSRKALSIVAKALSIVAGVGKTLSIVPTCGFLPIVSKLQQAFEHSPGHPLPEHNRMTVGKKSTSSETASQHR